MGDVENVEKVTRRDEETAALKNAKSAKQAAFGLVQPAVCDVPGGTRGWA